MHLNATRDAPPLAERCGPLFERFHLPVSVEYAPIHPLKLTPTPVTLWDF